MKGLHHALIASLACWLVGYAAPPLVLPKASAVSPAKVIPPPIGEGKRPDPPPLPKIDYLSNWGQIAQDGRKLTITGHETWQATGEIRKDGSVYILWIMNDSGRAAPGVYDFKDGKLVGKWGYVEDVQMMPDGSISGWTASDVTYPIKE